MDKIKNTFLLFFVLFLCLGIRVNGKEEMGELYAKSAVLMDAESGRVLYEKNGGEFLANASTTKILTCILALEEGNLNDSVTISEYAASMPDVQLKVNSGEKYLLRDLLYALMLESHNDVAVAIAEYLEGNCDRFSERMNEKAKEIGCKNTYFLTPNGLDAVKGEKSHGTTAEDLALIMRYCIMKSPKKEEFLTITAASVHEFTDLEGKRHFSCHNRNTFLQLMEGAISGKTGFTSKAGYCYVGALKRDERTYIVALLASGWPNNKHYKWEDSRTLLEYGLLHYSLFSLGELELNREEVLQAEVENGENEEGNFYQKILLETEELKEEKILLAEGERIEVKVEKKHLQAPVKENQVVGRITYLIEGKPWMVQELKTKEKVEKINYLWCLKMVIKKCFT